VLLVEGQPIHVSVPRSEIIGVAAGVWSPLHSNQVAVSGTFGPSGGTFGTQYAWGPLTYASATGSRGISYTEWIEVALEQPVYVFRVNIGQPRCA
jgi:hypothetical protein